MLCLQATGNDRVSAWLTGPPETIDAGWIDHNGHLHLPYYTVLFIRAVSAAMDRLGFGEAYAARGGGTFFGAEHCVRYLRELKQGDVVHIELCLLDCDAKRLHWWARMTSAEQGAIVATFELLSLHVDQQSRRVAPMPADVFEAVRSLRERQRGLGPREDGRRLDLRPAR